MHTQRIDPPGACLCYHDLPGRDPACVFLHGLGASSSADFTEIAGLAPMLPYRRILVDFFGFGFSERPHDFSYTLDAHARTIFLLLGHLRIPQQSCILIGHSMGGAVAITLTATDMCNAGGIVIAEGNLDPGGGVVSRPIAEQTEAQFLETGYARFLDILAQRPHVATYAASARVADPLALYRSAVALKAGTSPSMRERLATLSLPRMYLFGDESLPNPDEPWLRQQGIAVEVIASAGHNMMHENPSGVADAIARAVSRWEIGAAISRA
ncbi:alpha/beta fold hydrolase [Candidatus Bipolaricaulota bacterium]|nr:alpha/beta fold hydrolase [Candidatus Bipolaricaulota bacterium]